MTWIREAELPAANRIFVDREEPQLVFEKAAFNIPADHAGVRVFYGVGGQGKTALCRELMRKTEATVEPSYRFLRRALLDLHGRPKTDADLLLVWIRNAFAEKADLTFPCFDTALALMWESARGYEPFPTLLKPWMGRSLKAAKDASEQGASTAADWLHSDDAQELLGDALAEIPGVGFVLKRLGGWVIDKAKRAYLERTRPHLHRLHKDGELVPAHEISRLLPWMLAQDLNYHLEHNAQDRFVLFIDEYERVFDKGGAGAGWNENPFDRHMRSFIQETNGLLAVFFSRERLPWEQHPDWRDELRDHQHLLGGLADKDADDFLRAIPIADAAIREAIIDGARERSDRDAPVYPLLLDLQVEHWRNLVAKKMVTAERFTVQADSFEGRRIEIIERVLRDYGEALETTIERLSVAQRFDRDAFRHIVETFQTAVPLDNFDRIAKLSFVTQSEDGFLTLHNVVRAVIREQLGEEKKRTSIDALLTHFSERARVASHFELSPQKISALLEAANLRRSQGVDGYVKWLAEATYPLRTGANYAAATTLWREAADSVQLVLGPDHPDTAASYNNVAYCLNAQGRSAEAEPLFRKALEISERVLGPDHPSTAAHYNNVAYCLNPQGRSAEAEPLYRKALEIRERVLGPDHPDTAASYNNVASSLNAQGRSAEAEPLYRKALEIRERVLGPDHPDTAASYNNVASSLNAQGRSAEAEPLFRKALEISERVLGPDHPDTATSYNNVASNLDAQGRSAEAEPLYRKALEIRERVLGPDHPDTAASYNNVASSLNAQGRSAEAEPLFRKALEISERVLGPDHPDTATSYNNVASNLDAQGRSAEAEPLYRKALEIRERVLGPDHPSTAASYNNVAYFLDAQGRSAEAEPLYRKALEISERVLGPDHPDTAIIRRNLSERHSRA